VALRGASALGWTRERGRPGQSSNLGALSLLWFLGNGMSREQGRGGGACLSHEEIGHPSGWDDSDAMQSFHWAVSASRIGSPQHLRESILA
jgi:hypothetical protein